MQKYKIITYGCQMNIHESEKIAGILEDLGYGMCEEIESADVIVFNTCCIRDNAEKRALGNIGAVKRLKKANPKLIVAVVGCMTQQDGAGLKLREKYPYVDIVLGTNNLFELENCINNLKNSRKKSVLIDPCERPQVLENEKVYRTSGCNAWLNIMYGCNNFCTYCIVPYVRGRERSRKAANIIDEFKRLVDEGYKEITLLGQNVNSYGHDLDDGSSFAKLLEELAKIDGKHRIRFMTSHPKDLNLDVIDIIASSSNICNNIHLPIQSGSNKILKLMNRHYTREYYLDTIAAIKEKIPDCGITTDLMVGFPYEEEEDFEDTLDIVRKVKYSSAFTFIYSIRKGTKAALMPQVPSEVSKNRITRLIAEQNKITKELSREYEGKVYEVLCEDKAPKKDGFVCGRTDSGRMVTFQGSEDLIGRFVNVKIKKSQSASLFGDITED
ncbi:MAG: tRNA (N6-isopentenyl adenosine(37)-C2)-methylthiotransferase MiaB [Clostridia bacterium]|nr:tRNA (N6-isopentenyl adenosine(37)-C2)-methylthiotransferase MiaB [Clostridia bacterium]MDE7328703.1 tRNA (N6-isopentenyl adenosine(37)-C2)-methylthiotransferase MiaB [Clostridia bacterium]